MEKVEKKAYVCPAGKLTIGIGHTGLDVKHGMVITDAQAEALLKDDLTKFGKVVISACRSEPTQQQFDAMVAFAFNIGVGAFTKPSSVLRNFNNGDLVEAANSFILFRKITVNKVKITSRGLVRRRLAEKAMFENGIYIQNPENWEEIAKLFIDDEIAKGIRSK